MDFRMDSSHENNKTGLLNVTGLSHDESNLISKISVRVIKGNKKGVSKEYITGKHLSFPMSVKFSGAVDFKYDEIRVKFFSMHNKGTTEHEARILCVYKSV